MSESVAHDLRGTGVTWTHLAAGPTRTEFFAMAGLLDESRLSPVTMDAASVAAAGYGAMRAGRATVMPGLATKAMRAAAVLSPSRCLTGLVSGTSSPVAEQPDRFGHRDLNPPPRSVPG